MKKVQMILKRGIILLMSISVLCSTKTIHAYECENEECVETEEKFTEYVNSENTLQSVETDQIAEEVINCNNDFSTFNEKRETFWYYYIVETSYTWSLERDGELQFWKKYDYSNRKTYKSNVCAYYPAVDCVLYIENDVEIHMVDYSGENDVLLFSASESVREIVGNSEYFFYITDKGIYRYHIGSNTNEFVCITNDAFWLTVFDNQSFQYAEDHGELAYSEEDGTYSVYNYYVYDMTNESTNAVAVSDLDIVPTINIYEESEIQKNTEDYVEDEFQESESLYVFRDSIDINEFQMQDNIQLIEERNLVRPTDGSGLSFTDYGIGKYFTYDHGPCDHSKNGSTNCYHFGGDYQCAGYASYAYFLFHGNKKERDKKIVISVGKDKEKKGVPMTTAEWQLVPAGTYVRTSLPRASSGERVLLRHSIFIYENDGEYITIYEANSNGKCKITEKKIDISSMSNLYYPGNLFNKAFEHECVISSTYNSDDTYHWNTCEMGCVDRINRSLHTAGNWYNNGNGHSRNCTVCNKVMESKGHVLSGYLSDGTYHWRECVECGVVVEKSAHNSANVVVSETGHSYSCSICGRTISTTGHTYNSQYNLDGSHHWHNCSLAGCNSISGKETHAYSYSRVDASTHKGTCKCGHVITGSHNMRIGQPSSTAHQLICSTCGAVSSETHSYTISQNNGSTHKKTCSKCGYSVSEAHSVVYTNASAGSHSLRCSTCGYTETSAHTRITTKTKVATASICTRTAVKCKCNYVISTTTDRTHRYSGKTCLDCGYKK